MNRSAPTSWPISSRAQTRHRFILDVRAPDQFERWQIEGKADVDTVNIPYWTAIEEDDRVRELVPDNRPVVVACAHGGSSDLVVEVVGKENMHTCPAAWMPGQ